MSGAGNGAGASGTATASALGLTTTMRNPLFHANSLGSSSVWSSASGSGSGTPVGATAAALATAGGGGTLRDTLRRLALGSTIKVPGAGTMASTKDSPTPPLQPSTYGNAQTVDSTQLAADAGSINNAVAEEDATVSAPSTVYGVLENPMYKGRSLLSWLARRTLPASPTPAPWSATAPAAPVASPHPAALTSVQPQLPAVSADGGAVSAAVAGSSFSVDCSMLSELVKERISTPNLTVSTLTAPDTSRFTSTRSSMMTRQTAMFATSSAAASAGMAAANNGNGMLSPGELVYACVPVLGEEILSWSGMEPASGLGDTFGTLGTLGSLATTLRSTLRSTAALSTLGDGLGTVRRGGTLEAIYSADGCNGGEEDCGDKLARLAGAEVGTGHSCTILQGFRRRIMLHVHVAAVYRPHLSTSACICGWSTSVANQVQKGA